MDWGLGITVLVMLTIITEVVHQDDLVDQFRRTSVQNTARDGEMEQRKVGVVSTRERWDSSTWGGRF